MVSAYDSIIKFPCLQMIYRYSLLHLLQFFYICLLILYSMYFSSFETFISLIWVEFLLMCYEVTFPQLFSLLSEVIYSTLILFPLILNVTFITRVCFSTSFQSMDLVQSLLLGLFFSYILIFNTFEYFIGKHSPKIYQSFVKFSSIFGK